MLNLLEEEEKRKQQMGGVGAPLAAAPYQQVQEAAPVQRGPAERPGVAQQLATTYASGKAVQGMDKGVNWAWDKTFNTPTPNGAVSNEATFAGDYTNAMDQASDAVTAPLGAAPADAAAVNVANEAIADNATTAGMTNVGAPLATETATAGATDAASGMTAGTAGPLAGVVEFARTGDVKKGVGAGAGAAAGAVAGNALLPGVGGYVGSMIGAQLGSAVGGK